MGNIKVDILLVVLYNIILSVYGIKMSYYFEILDAGARYFSLPAGYYVSNTKRMGGRQQHLTQAANRIWEQQEAGVRYVKNRAGPSKDVDMKEFMWIALRAVEIDKL